MHYNGVDGREWKAWFEEMHAILNGFGLGLPGEQILDVVRRAALDNARFHRVYDALVQYVCHRPRCRTQKLADPGDCDCGLIEALSNHVKG